MNWLWGHICIALLPIGICGCPGTGGTSDPVVQAKAPVAAGDRSTATLQDSSHTATDTENAKTAGSNSPSGSGSSTVGATSGPQSPIVTGTNNPITYNNNSTVNPVPPETQAEKCSKMVNNCAKDKACHALCNDQGCNASCSGQKNAAIKANCWEGDEHC